MAIPYHTPGIMQALFFFFFEGLKSDQKEKGKPLLFFPYSPPQIPFALHYLFHNLGKRMGKCLIVPIACHMANFMSRQDQNLRKAFPFIHRIPHFVFFI
jgi:hypothetical protein